MILEAFSNLNGSMILRLTALMMSSLRPVCRAAAWPVCPASDPQCAAAAGFSGLGPVGLCDFRLHCDTVFNHRAISSFTQRDPVTK